MKRIEFLILSGILFSLNLYAGVSITDLKVVDTAGTSRTRFSSSESMGMKITANNDQEADRIYFYFYIYDSQGIKVFSHEGNSVVGKTGLAYSYLNNIPINFFTFPGNYQFEGKVAAGDSSVTQKKTFEIYSPQVTLSYPPNGVRELTDQPIVFRWISSGATRYKIYLDDEIGFLNPIWQGETTLTFIEYPLTPTDPLQKLTGDTIYWWKVTGFDTSGNAVAQCNLPFNFTVKGQVTLDVVRDLAVSDLTMLPESNSTEVKIEIKVKNLGSEIEINVPVDFYSGGIQILPSKRVDMINPGETKELIYRFMPLDKGLTLVSGSVVFQDSNPKNNILSKTFDFTFETREFSVISGMVKDEAGKNIPSAEVYYEGPISGQVTADYGGGYRIENLVGGKYEIYAKHIKYGDSEKKRIGLRAGEEFVNFDLFLKGQVPSEFVVIEGIVKDSKSGEEIADVGVFYEKGTKKDSIFTDWLGSYEIEGVEPGVYYLKCSHADYEESKKIKLSAQTGGQRYLYNFDMKRKSEGDSSAIYGWVKGEGEFLKGVKVVCQRSEGEVVSEIATGPDGKFEFKELNPGKYKILASYENFVTGQTEIKIRKGEKVQVTLDLELLTDYKSSGIAGIVRDKDGEPISDAVVSYGRAAEKKEELSGEVETDSKGIYNIEDLEPGMYKISVEHLCYNSSAKKVEVKKFNKIKCNFDLSAIRLDLKEFWKTLRPFLKGWEEFVQIVKEYELVKIEMKPPREPVLFLKDLKKGDYELKGIEIEKEAR